jgi:S-adenosylmethionine hydrolase
MFELYSILRKQFLAIGEWMRSIITLTTDFGVSSPYVAQMKGVILSICRDVELIELTHGIAAQNIREGAVVLADVTPRFPAGSIHVAVVDPGVGTARRIVYAEIGEQRYVAPDNGLLSLLAAREAPRATITVDNTEFWLPNHSQTFHGRDIMAPIAAHLAGGVKPQRLGQSAGPLVMLDWPEPTISSHGVAGEILYIDSFGNLVTNISREDVTRIGEPAALVVDCGGRRIRGIVSTYGAALEGEIIALFDSQERLEIAKVNGNAARELHLEVGERLQVLTE